MSTQVRLTYTIDPEGASAATVAAMAEAVPVPPDILQALGLRITGDSTPTATPVVRTIDISFVPSVAPTATASLDNEGRVTGVAVATHGIDIVSPPQIAFSGGNALRQALAKAFLDLRGVALVAGGGSYSGSTVAVVLGGMSPPTYITKFPPGYGRQEALGEVDKTATFLPSCVQNLRIAVQGKGYSTSATIQFVGGLDGANPAARAAQAVITTLGPRGEILGVQLIDPGEGYIQVPKVVVVDPAHAGGGFMVMRPNPITGAKLNPNTAGARFGDATPSAIKYVVANISPVMGQGTPASVTITVAGGIITVAGVTGGKNGARYIEVPQIFIYDPTGAGSGGVLTARMGLGSVELLTGGKGYESVPSAVLTPYFKSLFPDGSDQKAPFWKLIQTALQVAVLSPVESGSPFLS